MIVARIVLPRSRIYEEECCTAWFRGTDLIAERLTEDGCVLKQLDVAIIGDDVRRGSISSRHPVTCVEDIKSVVSGFKERVRLINIIND